MKNIVLILLLLAGLVVPYGARSQDVILKTDTISIPCAQTDTFLVPVRVSNFTNVGSFQFTYSWNATYLDYAYVSIGDPSNPFFQGGANPSFDTLTFINTGKLTFAWNKVGGGTYPDNTVLFYVAFRRLGGPFTPLQFVNSPVGIEVTDPLGEDLPWKVQAGAVKPIDGIPPSITCPLNVNQVASAPAPVNGISPVSVADNCVLQSVGWAATGATNASFPTDPDASGAVFGFGLSTVTYTATDVGGNTATCSFTVNIEPAISSDTLTLLLENASASCGQSIGIGVSAFNFDSLGSLQFSINWDPALLHFDSISLVGSNLTLSSANFGTTFIGMGKLSFSWTTASLFGTTIPQGAQLFRIYFTVAGTGTASVQFGDSPTFREAYSSAVQPPEEVPAFYIPGQIMILDFVPPTLVCPASISVQTQPGELTSNITGTAPTTLTDNCGPVTSLGYVQTGTTVGSGTGNADGTYNAGTSTVTYTATDASGNTATCSFTVLVDAGTSAKLMLEDVSANCQSANQQITMDFTVADFADILGLQFSIQWDPTQLQLASTVTNVYPGLNLTSFDFQNYQDTMSGLLRFLGGSASGNWPDIPDGGTFFTLTFNVVGPGPVTVVSFLGPLDAVNSAYVSVPVDTLNGVVSLSTDVAGPDFVNCPADTTVQLASGDCIATLNFSVAASDACSGLASLVSNQLDDQFSPGTTTVVYTATDVAGNSSSCTFNVTVMADNVLDITCPPSVTVSAADTSCSAAVTWNSPILNGVCDFTNLSVTTNFQPGDLFPAGSPTTVVYTAQDTVTGMLASCSFKVTVADTTRPVLVCPVNILVSADSVSNCQATVDFDIATVSDNCDQNPDLESDHFPGDSFGTGVTTVTYLATDDFNNTALCTFTVTVPDSMPPTLTCPPGITANVTPDSCNALAQWTAPQPFDDCDLSQIPPVSDHLSGELFPTGTTIVTYMAEDNSGNVASCTFTIVVVDNQLPTLTNCPANILVQLPEDQCDTTLTWTTPTVDDNCSQPTLTTDVQPNSSFPTGITTVTYTAIDDGNNMVSCTFTVTVVDQVAPVFVSCPQDTVIISSGPCSVTYPWTIPQATDNCTLDNDLVYSSSQMPTDSFPVGITTVVIDVQDLSSNHATCSFEVTVTSSAVAQFIQIPDTIFLETETCTGVATWNPPVPDGFCQMPVVTSNYEPGDTFPVGITTVIYTATNNLGVETTASFVVIVGEAVPPQITCPTADIVVSVAGAIITDTDQFLVSADTANGCTGATLIFNSPTATDNCGTALVLPQSGPSSGEVFPAGTTVMTYEALDDSGNSTTCSFNIVVQPLTALTPAVDPNPGCPGEVVTLTVPNIPGATYTWTGPQQTYPNSPTITLISLQQGNTGTYSVVASLNGCSTPAGSAQVQMVSKPDAVNDLTFEIDPSTTDTFNVLTNDIILLPDDIAVTQLSQLEGLTYLGNGMFAYTAGPNPGPVSFIYQICSAACPDPQFCDMATVTIRVKDVKCSFIPNIFTPNHDGVNDWLVIPCLDGGGFPNNSITIYNQWGDEVYTASPYDNDQAKAWQGTLKENASQDLPDGVYYYIFRASPNEPTLKGFIQIFR